MQKDRVIIGIVLLIVGIVVLGLLVIGLFVGVFLHNAFGEHDGEYIYVGVRANIYFEDVPFDNEGFRSYLRSSPNVTILSVYPKDEAGYYFLVFKLKGEHEKYNYSFTYNSRSEVNGPDLGLYYQYKTDAVIKVDSMEKAEEMSEPYFTHEKTVSQDIIDDAILEIEPFVGKNPAPFELKKDIEIPTY